MATPWFSFLPLICRQIASRSIWLNAAEVTSFMVQVIVMKLYPMVDVG